MVNSATVVSAKATLVDLRTGGRSGLVPLRHPTVGPATPAEALVGCPWLRAIAQVINSVSDASYSVAGTDGEPSCCRPAARAASCDWSAPARYGTD
ncbi:GNA1162 family protein [Cupriavidus basilensis]